MNSETEISNSILNVDVSNGKAMIYPLAPLTLKNGKEYDSQLNYDSLSEATEIIVDFKQVSLYDSFLVLFVKSITEFCTENSKELKFQGLSDDMNRYLALLFTEVEKKEIIIDKHSLIYKYFVSIGETTKIMFKDTRYFIEFFGELVWNLVLMPFRPTRMRWKDFPFNFMRAGVNAVPIVLLIVFLIGLISGYQGALQLKQFGADIYIADLVGISITRELAPLMTAILVAGRSGSAFAAEIGTMKVSEELDALKSMGYNFFQFLILPRVLAVMVAIPFVTILADVAGILGGLIAAINTLDITVAGYFNQLERALNFGHIFTGLGKSVIFGFLVATMGCFRGLQVSGGAESVGKYTTAAVVSGVFLIILTDAIFTFLFEAMGI